MRELRVVGLINCVISSVGFFVPTRGFFPFVLINTLSMEFFLVVTLAFYVLPRLFVNFHLQAPSLIRFGCLCRVLWSWNICLARAVYRLHVISSSRRVSLQPLALAHVPSKSRGCCNLVSSPIFLKVPLQSQKKKKVHAIFT